MTSNTVTLTDVALTLAAYLLGAATVAALIAALIAARVLARRRYQGRNPEPYAGFRTAAHTGNGHLMPLQCEGRCPGTRMHETDGDGGATCTTCGTPRVAGADTHLNGAS